MEKTFIPADWEKKIYESWEQKGLLKPKTNKNPYTVLMPPPNANASLHAGHGMYTVDDIMVRYQRLLGNAALWIPGVDHAGFETQFVYEKQLAKKGQSRFEFDRQTFYDNVFEFVKNNSGLIYEQFKRLGFLADWDRSVFTLDPAVIEKVFATFQKMENEGLVYRSDYIVNYCTHDGTSLSELEVKHVERTDALYYLKYGPFVLATVRPETKFGDTAIAVHPADKRYQKWIGKEVEVEGLLGKFKIKIIADEYVDPKFGTGVVKITPAHDPNDFEVGKRHNLEVKKVIDLNGRLMDNTGPYTGLKVKAARERVVSDLQKKGLIEKIEANYLHSVTTCYKCGRDLEPMIVPNWFIRVEELKKPVIKAVEKETVKFYPKKFKKQILDWLKVMHDWPISRQVAWGIRIPVWYKLQDNPDLFIVFLDKNKQLIQGTVSTLLAQYSFNDISNGLQKIVAPKEAKYLVSMQKPEGDYLQETDTFDTWFSSGQWPLVTLKEEEFKTRFPTNMLGTLSDILPFWVSRMIMFSLYLRKEVPFENVYLWSMVADAKGQKMSKSKGNVINPIELVDKYGADAFRAALLFGTGSGKVNLSEEKVKAMRNFANKLWNIARFIEMSKNANLSDASTRQMSKVGVRPLRASDKMQNLNFKMGKTTINELEKEFTKLEKKATRQMDVFQFARVFDELYEFAWHRLADYYIEALKEELKNGNMETLIQLEKVFIELVKWLHPFMPFVTEAIYQNFYGVGKSILEEKLS